MENIKVSSVEDKQTANGKSYKLVKDDKGNAYSYWSKNAIESGKTYECNIKEQNGYKQISAVIREVTKAADSVATQTAATQAATLTANSEPLFRINVKQMAKGNHQYEVTIRADTADEAKQRLDLAVKLAKDKVAELDASSASITEEVIA